MVVGSGKLRIDHANFDVTFAREIDRFDQVYRLHGHAAHPWRFVRYMVVEQVADLRAAAESACGMDAT